MSVETKDRGRTIAAGLISLLADTPPGFSRGQGYSAVFLPSDGVARITLDQPVGPDELMLLALGFGSALRVITGVWIDANTVEFNCFDATGGDAKITAFHFVVYQFGGGVIPVTEAAPT